MTPTETLTRQEFVEGIREQLRSLENPSKPYEGCNRYMTDGSMIIRFDDLFSDLIGDEGIMKAKNLESDFFDGFPVDPDEDEWVEELFVDGPPDHVGVDWHEVTQSDDFGEIKQICSEAKEAIEVLGQKFARRYLWLIKNLPNFKCFIYPEKNNALSFTFDGGKGFVMRLQFVGNRSDWE